MNTSSNTPSTPAVSPNSWFVNRQYAIIDRHDERKADVLRAALNAIRLYPSRDVQGEFPQGVVNKRAALHAMIDQLDDTELWAAYESVRLLAYTDRPSELFNA